MRNKKTIIAVDLGTPDGDKTAIVVAKKEKGVIKIKAVEPSGVAEMMKIFYQTNPTLNWANKTYRTSAAFMVNKFGEDNALNMARAAVSVQGQRFAPVITNPWELKEKLLKLKLFLDANNPGPKEIKEL